MCGANQTGRILKQNLFALQPKERTEDNIFSEIKTAVSRSCRKTVVLDDDPTGCQTVHGIYVLTSWQVDELKTAFLRPEPLFFILTNTRSFLKEKARAINEEIGLNLCQAARELGIEFSVISRGDSTLRGHYPDELDVLEDVLGKETGHQFDGQLLIPAFFEGGRYTINDVHYVQESEELVPAGETEFARDAVFGYQNSHLGLYIEEKTCGKVLAKDVVSIGLSDLRNGGSEHVVRILMQMNNGKRAVVNAASYRDLEIFVLGLLKSEEAGKRFLVRSSASFVKVRGAVEDRQYLTCDEMEMPDNSRTGGLVVVGSYVGKTSAQIKAVLNESSILPLEINVDLLLDENRRPFILAQIIDTVNKSIKDGIDVMIYTSRTLVTKESATGNLSIGRSVSAALVEIVRLLNIQPRFLIAKGGITSNDLATDALGVKASLVLGQVYPGIPVWKLGPETKFPGMSYVVFPGNVGQSDTLAQIILLFNRSISRIK